MPSLVGVQKDCKFCSQSAHHRTDVDVHDLLDEASILERALQMEAEGAKRYALVTSGRGISEEDLVNGFRHLSTFSPRN